MALGIRFEKSSSLDAPVCVFRVKIRKYPVQFPGRTAHITVKGTLHLRISLRIWALLLPRNRFSEVTHIVKLRIPIASAIRCQVEKIPIEFNSWSRWTPTSPRPTAHSAWPIPIERCAMKRSRHSTKLRRSRASPKRNGRSKR